METQNALLATLVCELLELQAHQMMLLQSAGLLQPPLREAMLLRLERIAETIDTASEAAFPPELAVHLHTTALRLHDLS
ncbi:hypothetical protein [Sphingobium yanoikuyae]|uniref:hypothetical protein n=1 Tax=Sphingobium yanoikuyae TaxID=13690 RepID=UPI002FDD02DA